MHFYFNKNEYSKDKLIKQHLGFVKEYIEVVLNMYPYIHTYTFYPFQKGNATLQMGL